MQLIIRTCIFQVYAPALIARVRLKHQLAELQFSHLYTFDNDYAEVENRVLLKIPKIKQPADT